MDRTNARIAKQTFHGARPPAGWRVKPEHYLTFDRLATQYGNKPAKTCDRAFNFTASFKSGLGPMMKAINEAIGHELRLEAT